jgi:alpha-beta hydrolase superfamily lysophospholipase
MAAIAAPVLAFLPGDENIVDPAASRRMLAALPDCQIIGIDDARHELLSELQEVKTRLFDELDQFLKLDHKTDFTSALGVD